MNTTALLLVFAGVTCGIIGDAFLKTAGRSGGVRLVAGVIVYALSAWPVWISYRLASFVSISLTWQAISISLALMVGVFLFHERLTSRQVCALAFMIGALGMLCGGGEEKAAAVEKSQPDQAETQSEAK